MGRNAHVAVCVCFHSDRSSRQTAACARQMSRILDSSSDCDIRPISALHLRFRLRRAIALVASFETRALPAPLVRASRTSHSSRSSSSRAPAMAAMSAVAPVCLRASAPSARKSRAGRISSRVAAPAALRTSAVTGRRAQGMSVSSRPSPSALEPLPSRARPARIARRASRTDRGPLGCYRARIPTPKARYVSRSRDRSRRPSRNGVKRAD
jgi:hypothetical protein